MMFDIYIGTRKPNASHKIQFECLTKRGQNCSFCLLHTHIHANIYIHRRAHALCFCSYFSNFVFYSVLFLLVLLFLIQINIVLYVHYISACDLRTKSNTSCHSTPQHSSSDSEQPCDLRLFTPTTCLRELAVRQNWIQKQSLSLAQLW